MGGGGPQCYFMCSCSASLVSVQVDCSVLFMFTNREYNQFPKKFMRQDPNI